MADPKELDLDNMTDRQLAETAAAYSRGSFYRLKRIEGYVLLIAFMVAAMVGKVLFR